LPGGDGYLFSRPRGTATFRFGYAQPFAASDVFSHSSRFLTLGRHSFAGVSYGVDFGFRLDDRTDFQLGLAYATKAAGSEFRDYIDNNDAAIEQSTTFERVPLTLGFKRYLSSPGLQAGQLAWVPSKFTPYITGGGGWVHYAFKQTGDFVDFQSLDVFHASLKSSAWTPMAFGAGGAEYTVRKDASLITELRYDFARGPMSEDFLGFHRIDLSGLSATIGLTFRY
jgi:hypothetical protein